jgi:hypothetical protein
LARTAKLKVFRTPIGFHDAYVAAPSQKAALEAWHSDHNLFARGEAELVSDPALTAEPLAHPGKVIKRLRGTTEEQMAALGPARRKTDRAPKKAAPTPERKAATKPKPKPRPDRAPLDRAEAALADAEQRYARAHQAIIDEEKRLAQRRRALEKEQDTEVEKLKRELEQANAAYRDALDRWRGDT